MVPRTVVMGCDSQDDEPTVGDALGIEKAASPQSGFYAFGIVTALAAGPWKVDRLSTALGTEDHKPRTCRHGYGALDENLNGAADATGKKVCRQVGDHLNYVRGGYFGQARRMRSERVVTNARS